MPLIKRRPEIHLYAPRAVSPGTTVMVRVILRCGEAVPVNAIDVELRGSFVWFVRSQYGSSPSDETFLRQRARVAESGELDAGDHSYSARFTLPTDLPATYDGQELRIKYAVHVHVDIPWWPDARAAFVVRVMPPPAAAPADSARVFASAPGGASGGKPYFEVSLGGTDVEAGESIHGAVALANASANDYRALEMILLAVETIRRPLGRYTHHRKVRSWTMSIADVGDEAPQRFTIALPEEIVPGFELNACSLRWFLEVRARVAWTRDPQLYIPLTVRGSRQVLAGDEVRAPLAVGSERLSLIWRSVAQARALEYVDGALHGALGEVRVLVGREHRGRSGGVLVAELRYPELGIDLALDAGELRSRDPAQLAWLRERLGDPLRARPPTVADDRRLGFELYDAGQDRATLLGFVDELLAIAGPLDGALRELPPPTAMAARVPAWEEAARTLGARLRVGPMVISGRADAMTVEIATGWDERGAPHQTVFELRPAATIDRRHHVTWTAGEPAPESELLLAPLLHGARALDIAADSIRVFLGGPLDDPLTELERITALIDLGQRLEGRRGFYR
ncbi:MAG: hypothetical protein R3A79_16605 [Nannocystaceae bacterium]